MERSITTAGTRRSGPPRDNRRSKESGGAVVILVEAGKTESEYYRDLWRYRDLFFFLMWRDILVRYKQTALGVLWAVLRPLLTMLVFTFIFGRLAKLPSSGTPYPLLVLSRAAPCGSSSPARSPTPATA